MKKPNDLILRAKGEFAKVYITPSAEKVLKRQFKGDYITPKGIQKRFEQYANNGPKNFDHTQFKSQGRHSTGTKNAETIIVYVFKFKQARLYGCIDENNNVFICVAVDKKKQDKVLPGKLDSIAKKYTELVATINEGE